MRTLGLLVLAGGILGISTLHAGTVCAPGAGIWNEGDDGQGDAGKFPGSANVTTGSGSLNEICGNLDNSSSGGDMFEIMITGTTFSALTSEGNKKNGIGDPALYLFDANGDGLYANNDLSSTNTQAGFTLTGLTPGLYFLIIVPDNQQPENPNGKLIFGDITGTNTTVFTPVVKNTKLDSWTDAGDTGGTYIITLTDAGFATPEPATFGLIGAGLGLLAFGARRRRG